MIEHDYKYLFSDDSVDKQLVISNDDNSVVIANTEFHENSFELEETLCDEKNLVFGSVYPSKMSFTASNVFIDMKDMWLTATTSLKNDASNSFKFGQYKVYSDTPTADRKKRNVVAYDALYDVLQADVAEWYNNVLPLETTTVTLKKFRDKFFAHFGIEQEDVSLINDNMLVKKTIQPEELSGKTVINCICEINGCFGHIGRDGKFKYIYLKPISEGLYPSETLYPSENLYPSEPNTNVLKTGHYISATYEDFIVEQIDKLQIRQEEDDIGAIIGSGDNAYVIQDNFLVYGKSTEELNTIGQNILDKIGGIYYRPFTAKAKGNPCLEVGDGISLSTKYMAIHSYILQRTLSGIQALRDEYTAEGTQYQPEEVNSTQKQIIQLKGKANKLTRTIEETRLEMEDIEKGLYSEISITAGQIRTEIQNTKTGLESSISQTASQIRTEVSNSNQGLQSQITQNAGSITSEINRATNAENALSTRITQTDEKIRLDVSETYETITNVDTKVTGAKGYTDEKLKDYSTTVEMNSSIQLKADSITQTVSATYETKTDADIEYERLQSQITLNADEILLRVTADKAQSMIDITIENIVLSAKQISLEGYTTINDGFSVDTHGNIIAKSGTIGDFTLNNNRLYRIDENTGAELGFLGSSLNISRDSNEAYLSYSNLSISDDSYNVVISPSRIQMNRILSTGIGKTWLRLDKSSDIYELNGHEIITAGNIAEYTSTSDVYLTGQDTASAGEFYADVYLTNLSADPEDSFYTIPTTYWVKEYIDEQLKEIREILDGGSWTYLQLEGYDGDEYAYNYFTK